MHHNPNNDHKIIHDKRVCFKAFILTLVFGFSIVGLLFIATSSTTVPPKTTLPADDSSFDMQGGSITNDNGGVGHIGGMLGNNDSDYVGGIAGKGENSNEPLAPTEPPTEIEEPELEEFIPPHSNIFDAGIICGANFELSELSIIKFGCSDALYVVYLNGGIAPLLNADGTCVTWEQYTRMGF